MIQEHLEKSASPMTDTVPGGRAAGPLPASTGAGGIADRVTGGVVTLRVRRPGVRDHPEDRDGRRSGVTCGLADTGRGRGVRGGGSGDASCRPSPPVAELHSACPCLAPAGPGSAPARLRPCRAPRLPGARPCRAPPLPGARPCRARLPRRRPLCPLRSGLKSRHRRPGNGRWGRG